MRIAGCFICCMLSCSAQGGIYRCTIDGRVTITDRPCENTEQQEKIHIKTTQPPVDTPFARQKKYLDAIAEERAFNQKQAQEAQKKQREQQQACDRLNATLKTYQAPGRLYQETTGGEREYLSDQARAKTIADIQRAMQRSCRG